MAKQTTIIKRVGAHLVDVFFGSDGWEPHTRFQIGRGKDGIQLNYVSGAKKVPKPVLDAIVVHILVDDKDKRDSLTAFNRSLDAVRRKFRAPQRTGNQ